MSIEADERQRLVYPRRTLPEAPARDRVTAYEHPMEIRPARDGWTEFVFEACVNHRPDVIVLRGLPDIPESRPHWSVNGR